MDLDWRCIRSLGFHEKTLTVGGDIVVDVGRVHLQESNREQESRCTGHETRLGLDIHHPQTIVR